MMDSAPHFREPLLKTPFHARARALSQLDSFIPWAGYTTVDVFSSVEQEYFAIRNATTVYDLTPMVKYRIAGPGATGYLNRLVTRDVGKLKPNRVAYCVWCDDAGHVIDDGTIFRLSEREYRLCTAERQLDWLLDSAIGFDVEIAEVTADIAALALQGPTSCAALKDYGIAGIQALKPFEIGHYAVGANDIVVSRTGFTGDLGYELWMRPERAEDVWDGLMAAGASRRDLSCRTPISSPPNIPFTPTARVRRWSSGWTGSSTSRKGTSPDGARCWPSNGAASVAGSWDLTSTATSLRTMLSCTMSGRGSARSAA